MATVDTASTPPNTAAQAAGEARKKRRPALSAVIALRPPAGRIPPTTATVCPHRSGNVTAQPGTSPQQQHRYLQQGTPQSPHSDRIPAVQDSRPHEGHLDRS